MKNLILAGMSAVLLVGCINVPSTEISFNPKTKSLTIKSPKDVTIGSATVIQNSNGFTMTITNYASTNNAQLAIAVEKAKAEVAKSYLQTMDKLTELGKTLAEKAP